MLEKEITLENSESSKPRMKDGEEPTAVLLGLVSSPLITLKARGLARVLTARNEKGQPIVLAVFEGVEWSDKDGIFLAVPLPTVPMIQPTVPEETANSFDKETENT